MIYLEHRSLFIHIPRTSGMSLAHAVLSHGQLESSGINLILGHGLGPFWRHVQAHVLQQHVSEWTYPQLQKWTIVRNPWRICESMFRHFQRKHRQLTQGVCPWFDVDIQHQIEGFAQASFESFVLSHFQFLRQGFFAHWALEWESNRDLGVEALRFEDLDRHWPHVCRLLQLPPNSSRPKSNVGDPARTLWTKPAIEFIQKRCRLDFERFAYPQQP